MIDAFFFGTTNTIRCFDLIWAEAQSEKPQYSFGWLGWKTGVIQRKMGKGFLTTKGLLYFSIAGASVFLVFCRHLDRKSVAMNSVCIRVVL
jgi:hypothetical protein